jgi:hypothetical protein
LPSAVGQFELSDVVTTGDTVNVEFVPLNVPAVNRTGALVVDVHPVTPVSVVGGAYIGVDTELTGMFAVTPAVSLDESATVAVATPEVFVAAVTEPGVVETDALPEVLVTPNVTVMLEIGLQLASVTLAVTAELPPTCTGETAVTFVPVIPATGQTTGPGTG